MVKIKIFSFLRDLVTSEEQQAYNESYKKKCVELAHIKGEADAKDKYKEE